VPAHTRGCRGVVQQLAPGRERAFVMGLRECQNLRLAGAVWLGWDGPEDCASGSAMVLSGDTGAQAKGLTGDGRGRSSEKETREAHSC